VCDADEDTAWISAAGGGFGGSSTYHAGLICQQLGYSAVSQYGGTCRRECGSPPSADVGCPPDLPGSSCSNPGARVFIGGGLVTTDEFGPVLCCTVHWECTR
jgi:hypothetical protein